MVGGNRDVPARSYNCGDRREITVESNEMQIKRIEHLERVVRTAKGLSFLSLMVVVALFVVEKYVLASSSNDRVLHVRGIVIEDLNGIPRLLLGAPILNQGRKRQDAVTGIILLGEERL